MIAFARTPHFSPEGMLVPASIILAMAFTHLARRSRDARRAFGPEPEFSRIPEERERQQAHYHQHSETRLYLNNDGLLTVTAFDGLKETLDLSTVVQAELVTTVVDGLPLHSLLLTGSTTIAVPVLAREYMALLKELRRIRRWNEGSYQRGLVSTEISSFHVLMPKPAPLVEEAAA